LVLAQDKEDLRKEKERKDEHAQKPPNVLEDGHDLIDQRRDLVHHFSEVPEAVKHENHDEGAENSGVFQRQLFGIVHSCRSLNVNQRVQDYVCKNKQQIKTHSFETKIRTFVQVHEGSQELVNLKCESQSVIVA
jgi:hypothetical protein